jgi:CHAD domain-containing protein
VQSHLGDVPDSEAQLYLIEYVAIQEALDGQPIATGRPATVAAQLLYQQQIAYWNALQDLQKKMPARAQYAIVATLGS